MPKKKSDAPATRKAKLYELVEERRPQVRRGVDPIDDLLLDEERELSREAKRMRLEEIIAKKRREIDKMKQGQEMGMGSLPSNTDFLNMARFMAELSPDEAQRVRNAYSFFKMAEKGQTGGGMQLLPMLLGYARQNPGASENQMIQYLKLMDAQLLKGMEISKSANPKADGSIELLKIFKDFMTDSMKKPMEELVKKVQPQASAFEQILMNPEMFGRAKEIGMFGGGSNAAASKIDLEIEKIRGERTMMMRKWELEAQKENWKRQTEDRRTDNLLMVLGPIAGAIAGTGSERMRELGQKQAATYNPTSLHSSPPGPAPQQSAQIKCTCGYEGTVPRTDPPQTEIQCPECGQVLMVNTPETEEKRSE